MGSITAGIANAGCPKSVQSFSAPALTRLSNPIPGRGREGLKSLRVFGRLPVTGRRGCREAGVRKASREETAGEFKPRGSSHRRWYRPMGNLAPLVDWICRLRTGRRMSEQRGAGFGCPGCDRRSDRYSLLRVLPAEGGADGRCRRSVAGAGEMAVSGGSGDRGWRQGCGRS